MGRERHKIRINDSSVGIKTDTQKSRPDPVHFSIFVPPLFIFVGFYFYIFTKIGGVFFSNFVGTRFEAATSIGCSKLNF